MSGNFQHQENKLKIKHFLAGSNTHTRHYRL